MKRLLFIFLFLIAGAWLGLKIHADPGYVLISYQNITAETTLWFALIALFVSILAMALILRTGVKVLSAPSRLSQWFSSRAKHNAHNNTLTGIECYLQNDWPLAEKKLIHAAKHSKHAQINYLFAALACGHRGDTDKAQRYMHQAQRSAPSTSLAPSLTQVALLLNQDNEDSALDALKQLQKQKPQHTGISSQLAQLYAKNQAWSALADLLPIIKRHKLMPKDQIAPLEAQSLTGVIPKASSLKDLQIIWQQASKEVKQLPGVLGAYCQQLIAFEQLSEASKLLKKHLSKTWNEGLITCFTPLCQMDAKATLNILLSLAKKHPDSAPLHACIGLCYFHQEMLGQAKNYLLQSSELDPSYGPAWRHLSQMAETEKNYKQAYFYSQKSCDCQ
jgi:HemY protein